MISTVVKKLAILWAGTEQFQEYQALFYPQEHYLI